MQPIVVFLDTNDQTIYLDVTRIESVHVIRSRSSVGVSNGAYLDVVMQSGQAHRRWFYAKPEGSDVTYTVDECMAAARSFAAELLRFDIVDPNDPSFPF